MERGNVDIVKRSVQFFILTMFSKPPLFIFWLNKSYPGSIDFFVDFVAELCLLAWDGFLSSGLGSLLVNNFLKDALVGHLGRGWCPTN